jgi:hypothetical protein
MSLSCALCTQKPEPLARCNLGFSERRLGNKRVNGPVILFAFWLAGSLHMGRALIYATLLAVAGLIVFNLLTGRGPRR